MTDNERAELWKQLKTQEAEASERYAAAAPDTMESFDAYKALSYLQLRVRALDGAKDIRALLAKIESIDEP